MSASATENFMGAPQKKSVAYQIRCTRDWIDRVERAANALEMSAAAYIRMVTTERMNHDNVPHDDPPPRRKPRRPA